MQGTRNTETNFFLSYDQRAHKSSNEDRQVNKQTRYSVDVYVYFSMT